MTFRLDMAQDASPEELKPLYDGVLGPDTPEVIIPDGLTVEDARAWLARQHKRYRAGVGKRSHILEHLRLEDRVVLIRDQSSDAERNPAG